MAKEKGVDALAKEIARNAKGQTEHEFFSEKLDTCAANLDDLPLEQKLMVEKLVEQFGHFHSCTTVTKNNLIARVDVDDSDVDDEDDELPDSIAPELRAHVQGSRRRVLNWLQGTKHSTERATATKRWRTPGSRWRCSTRQVRASR